MHKVAGADISKDWIDVCLAGKADVARLPNTAEAIAVWLRKAAPDVVAFEPTGGYERTLQAVLRELGILYTRLHPNRLVAFRKARGVRAKTDKIDARLIADCAADSLARGQLRTAIPADDELRELAARRRQLVAELKAERCRLAIARSAIVRASLTDSVERLRADLDVIEAALAERIGQLPPLRDLDRVLQTLKGVGKVTSMTLLADLPELGCLSGKEIAALVGLAPCDRESGKTKGRARTTQGRTGVRAVLFNAARSAVRHPGPLRVYYDRLVTQNGRPGKVALTAVMRKMLVILNAMARTRTPWAGAAKSA